MTQFLQDDNVPSSGKLYHLKRQLETLGFPVIRVTANDTIVDFEALTETLIPLGRTGFIPSEHGIRDQVYVSCTGVFMGNETITQHLLAFRINFFETFAVDNP